jgi:hypothetical protein
MAAEGVTPFQKAVAWCMTSPVGMGSAANHTGGDAGPVDTVYLGVYRRDAIERAGGYDENMIVAEDWELNYRIRGNGGLIWFTPELRVTYRPRATLYTLAHQHFRYGRWRRVVARRYPETVNRRYLAPPAAAAAVVAGTLLGIAGLADWAADGPPAALYGLVGLAVPVAYLAGVTGAAFFLARDLESPARARVPLVLATMHMTWGLGFLSSPRKLGRQKRAK